MCAWVGKHAVYVFDDGKGPVVMYNKIVDVLLLLFFFLKYRFIANARHQLHATSKPETQQQPSTSV